MISFDYYLLIASILILISVAIARYFHNLGIPTLLLFIGVGMLAGSDGIGGIEFDDPFLSQNIGIVALVIILFSGGVETNWKSVKPVIWPALSLATLGVALTAGVVALFAYLILDIPFILCLLIGAIVSSTDAAAVFNVLNAKNVSLKNKLKPLLELESGSNDPMAVFLTIGVIQLYVNPDASIYQLIPLFFFQMGLGSLIGFSLGTLLIAIINHLRVPYQGVYSVFSLAFVCFIYALTAILNGSGFIAVYIAGIIVGNHQFIQKKTLVRFYDSLAWLSQIGLFIILGLLVFPTKLLSIAGPGLLLSLVLIFIARPFSVFISLLFSKFSWKEKSFISWVGLRGAVPIILATFPYMYKITNADLFFSLVFFIVLTSALLQGWTLNPSSKLLRVYQPNVKRTESPIEFAPVEGINAELTDFYVFEGSRNIGKTIVELGLPKDSLVVLINRNENYIVPSGGSVVEQGDILLTLVSNETLPELKEILSH